jgi:hypothetical protein
VQERLTGLLTHRQAGSVPAAGSGSAVGRPWWRRWSGRRRGSSRRATSSIEGFWNPGLN